MKIILLITNSEESFAALERTNSLCSNSKSYSLTIAHLVALNEQSNLPGLHNLDQAFNLQIESQAEESIDACLSHISCNYPNLKHEFKKISGKAEIGPLIQEFVESNDVDLVVVGSRNLGPAKRFVLGSVSDYVVHHLKVPVMVCKV